MISGIVPRSGACVENPLFTLQTGTNNNYFLLCSTIIPHNGGSRATRCVAQPITIICIPGSTTNLNIWAP